ncbi:phage tail tape measure protein, partial [Pseudomonas sp. GW247-3R2A]
ELKQFAEDAVKMGIAFDQTADQSGDMMAKWRTSFKMTQPEVVTLADKINYLSNIGPSSAAQISDIVTRIGSLGGIAGLSAGQV